MLWDSFLCVSVFVMWCEMLHFYDGMSRVITREVFYCWALILLIPTIAKGTIFYKMYKQTITVPNYKFCYVILGHYQMGVSLIGIMM